MASGLTICEDAPVQVEAATLAHDKLAHAAPVNSMSAADSSAIEREGIGTELIGAEFIRCCLSSARLRSNRPKSLCAIRPKVCSVRMCCALMGTMPINPFE